MLGTFKQFLKACIHTVQPAGDSLTLLFWEKWLRKARAALVKVWNCCIVPASYTGTSENNFKQFLEDKK